MGTFLHVFGIDTTTGPWYAFWSGAGSDLAYLSVFAGFAAAYRKHNCQVKRCPRLGRHVFTDPADGVARSLCWRHHPDVKHRQLTRARVAEIQRRRHLYLGDKPGKG